ncbi:MAG: ribosome maturation factor RimP [Acidobacteria bacterium]|nr:ribosome maturation factor RimP [Acidobacteriota bacterium]
MTEILEKVRGMAGQILDHAGMQLVHVEVQREPGGLILRLYIDKDGGVTLDDCAHASRQISARLDVDDPIEDRYTLEVSSPGLDRPLITEIDFTRFAGRSIRLSTRVPLDGRRHFQGRLDGLVEGSVRMTLEGGRQVEIPRDQVARARLEVEI